jgi:hypothetical protein
MAKGSHQQRRPSSEFDAIERDFFAREADLYKEESGETHLADPSTRKPPTQ